MANEEQLALLKQGVDVWNQWREENPNTKIDLKEAHFVNQDFTKINLERANLESSDFQKTELVKANLIGAILRNSDFRYTRLWGADLSKSDLTNADFNSANLNGTVLENTNLSSAEFVKAGFWDSNFQNATLYNTSFLDADLRKADFRKAKFNNTKLNGSNLREANLRAVTLSGVELRQTLFDNTVIVGTDFSESIFGETKFVNCDLSKSNGLEISMHIGPSYIETITLQNSRGKIPVEFLRGCGLSDWEITSSKLYAPDLSNEEISEITQNIFDLKATRPIQISPLFISYSHANSDFVDTIETKLNEKGIRFWRDIHNATSGRLETQIDRAIRHNPTVLLILSEHSTSSDWVEHEARLARNLEKELGRDALCPIALDDSWKTCNWPERIKEQIMEYNILDFSNWKDDDELDAMFKRLIDGLDMFYKK